MTQILLFLSNCSFNGKFNSKSKRSKKKIRIRKYLTSKYFVTNGIAIIVSQIRFGLGASEREKLSMKYFKCMGEFGHSFIWLNIICSKPLTKASSIHSVHIQNLTKNLPKLMSVGFRHLKALSMRVHASHIFGNSITLDAKKW